MLNLMKSYFVTNDTAVIVPGERWCWIRKTNFGAKLIVYRQKIKPSNISFWIIGYQVMVCGTLNPFSVREFGMLHLERKVARLFFFVINISHTTFTRLNLHRITFFAILFKELRYSTYIT